jgi:uncharacterized Ntn-hydrolase superfamily protein
MNKDLERLWELADEKLEQAEAARDDAESTDKSTYHDGWADAMKWLLEHLEEKINLNVDVADDEW